VKEFSPAVFTFRSTGRRLADQTSKLSELSLPIFCHLLFQIDFDRRCPFLRVFRLSSRLCELETRADIRFRIPRLSFISLTFE